MDRESMRRLHSATGLFPLGAYLLFHAWEHFPVRESRDALFARLSSSHNAVIECAIVLLPLLVHALLGLRLYLANDAPVEDVAGYVSPSFRRLQAVTGLLTTAFLVLHLLGGFLPRITEPHPIGAAYMGVRGQVERMPGLILYVIGVSAVCTHFGQGLGLALIRFSPTLLSPRGARIVGIVLGVLIWLIFLNELAAYATGASLL